MLQVWVCLGPETLTRKKQRDLNVSSMSLKSFHDLQRVKPLCERLAQEKQKMTNVKTLMHCEDIVETDRNIARVYALL